MGTENGNGNRKREWELAKFGVIQKVCFVSLPAKFTKLHIPTQDLATSTTSLPHSCYCAGLIK